MNITEFNENAFADMVRLTLAYVREQHPEITEREIRMRLVDMLLTHGKNAVNDMYAFYLWSVERDKEHGWIWASIMHDLNACNDRFMQPRTFGYMDSYFKHH